MPTGAVRFRCSCLAERCCEAVARRKAVIPDDLVKAGLALIAIEELNNRRGAKSGVMFASANAKNTKIRQ